MTALLVARPLFPSESAAAQGDGLPMVILWLSLFVIWAVAAIGRRGIVIRFGPVDAAVLALVVWQSISAVYALRYGSPRPALNMLWEWVGLATLFFLARQLIHDACEVRAVVAAMIALMAAISVYGIYQSAIELPALQKKYSADKEGELRKAGLNYPPGTPLRELFENRLKNREPTATFALTNSLAAALAPWLLIALGLAAATWRDRRRLLVWLICIVPIAACLLLTKSRSGYLAVAAGVICLVWRSSRHQSSRHTPCAVRPAASAAGSFRSRWLLADGTRRVPATLAGLLVVALLITFFAKPKAAASLGYRLQYWQATLRMIADRPLLGCGPGNFQDVYTQYKLPEASEEVADPHDFLLEVWATAGTPAMLALLSVLGLFWVRLRSPGDCRVGEARESSYGVLREPVQNPDAVSQGDDSVPNPPVSRRFAPRTLQDSHDGGLKPTLRPWKLVIAGTIAGFLLSYPLGLISMAPPSSMAIVIGLPVAVLCLVPLIPWVRSGIFQPALAGMGIAVLLVDLLTTGGIGMPAIAQSLWLLLALGLNGAWPRDVPRSAVIVLLVIGLGLLLACHQTGYARVLPSQGFQQSARREYLEGHRQEAQELAQKAVDADPLSSDARAMLAEIYVDAWLANLDSADYAAFEIHDALARRLAPQAAPIWRASAERYRRAFGKTDAQGRRRHPRAIEKAIEIARRTVELYPGSGGDHAALAMTYLEAGDMAACRREAQAALELDRRMPHDDKKLADALRQRLEAVVFR